VQNNRVEDQEKMQGIPKNEKKSQNNASTKLVH
jgi:hypothetical protein